MAQVGGIRLAEIAKELELKGKSDDMEGVAERFIELEYEYNIFKKALLEYAEKLS